MSRGIQSDCVIRHRLIRALHKKRIKELGDLANDVSRESIIRYIIENLKNLPGKKKKYSEVRIRQILNMSPEKIKEEEEIAKEDLFEIDHS